MAARSGAVCGFAGWRWAAFVVAAGAMLLTACVDDHQTATSSETHEVVSPSPTVEATREADATQTSPPATPTPMGSADPPTPIPSPTPASSGGSEAVVQPDRLVSLRLGEHVRIADTGWTVTFREVIEDSRCRPEVQCIWAGQIVVRLVGEHADGRVAALTLTMPAGSLGSGVLGDLHVEAQVDPGSLSLVYVLTLRAGVPQPASPSNLSGVRGHVTIGPMCPVMREDVPCPDRPYQAILTARDAAGREVARIESGADGTYSIPLGPGSYVLTPQPPSAGVMPRAAPHPFEVRALLWTTVDVVFDSGIR